MSEPTCFICQVSILNLTNDIKLECNHHICINCVRVLIKNGEQRCPFCRLPTVRLFLGTQNSLEQLHLTDDQIARLTQKIDDFLEISTQLVLKPPPYSYLIAKVSQHLGYPTNKIPQYCIWNTYERKKWEKWWHLIVSPAKYTSLQY